MSRPKAQSLMAFSSKTNTANYDLTFHRLNLEVNPEVDYIKGEVTSHYKVTQALSTIVFDLSDALTVTSVTKNGKALAFSQNTNDELIINLEKQYAQGTVDSLTIAYEGVPAKEEQAFTITSHNNVPALYTLSEPYGAKDWWPCKQDINDKIDAVEINITAPSKYVAVANGLETKTHCDTTHKTTTFKHNYPIPSYLIAIAVTNYEVYTHTVGEGDDAFDIVNYVYPESRATAEKNTKVTVDIMNVFQELFEAYPYKDEKYGHAQLIGMVGWNIPLFLLWGISADI